MQRANHAGIVAKRRNDNVVAEIASKRRGLRIAR